MHLITAFRAMSWVGFAVILWSNNLVWGDSADVGAGPPGQWKRAVIGAALLALISAIAISASGRRGNPPSRKVQFVAAITALGAAVIAFELRRSALAATRTHHLLEGSGFYWMASGAALATVAVIGTFTIRPKIVKPRTSRKRRSSTRG